MKSDKASITPAELELTQKMQMHFPWGQLPPEITAQWNGCKADALTRQLLDFLKNGPSKVSLLQKLAGVSIPALGLFSASEKFQENYGTKAKPGVKIYDLGSNFQSWFLGDDGVVCEPTEAIVLDQHKLLKDMNDDSIIQELGGQEVLQETAISQVYWLMEQQPDGEKGVLLTNGYANIFYCRDKNGVLRTVRVRWYVGDGWLVNAYEITDPREWNADYQVFSRNSSALNT